MFNLYGIRYNCTTKLFELIYSGEIPNGLKASLGVFSEYVDIPKSGKFQLLNVKNHTNKTIVFIKFPGDLISTKQYSVYIYCCDKLVIKDISLLNNCNELYVTFSKGAAKEYSVDGGAYQKLTSSSIPITRLQLGKYAKHTICFKSIDKFCVTCYEYACEECGGGIVADNRPNPKASLIPISPCEALSNLANILSECSTEKSSKECLDPNVCGLTFENYKIKVTNIIDRLDSWELSFFESNKLFETCARIGNTYKITVTDCYDCLIIEYTFTVKDPFEYSELCSKHLVSYISNGIKTYEQLIPHPTDANLWCFESGKKFTLQKPSNNSAPTCCVYFDSNLQCFECIAECKPLNCLFITTTKSNDNCNYIIALNDECTEKEFLIYEKQIPEIYNSCEGDFPLVLKGIIKQSSFFRVSIPNTGTLKAYLIVDASNPDCKETLCLQCTLN